MKQLLLVFSLLVIITASTIVEAQRCSSSGKLKGKKPPKGQCHSECCKPGKLYTTYQCSPPVSKTTKAIMTMNSFQKGGDGGGPAACDGKYHSDETRVVALSTGWFNKKKRCKKNIVIHANGKSVKAMVVDECDSSMGCDKEHAYQPPCPNNVVDASRGVWEELGVPKSEWGWMDVSWSDE